MVVPIFFFFFFFSSEIKNSSDMSLVKQLIQVLKLDYYCLSSVYLTLNIHSKKLIVRMDIKLNLQFKDNLCHPYL